MIQWEYNTLKLEIDLAQSGFFTVKYNQDLDEDAKVDISQLGKEGWEMFSVMPLDSPGIISGTRNAVAFFKRPLH